MKAWVWPTLLLFLVACGNLFEGGVILGGPTILAEVSENQEEILRDENGDVTGYRYSYILSVYVLPGSSPGTVAFLDDQGNDLGLILLIPSACPPTQMDPCGPYTKSVVKESPTPLAPRQATKYRIVSPTGQSKEVPLSNPLTVY